MKCEHFRASSWRGPIALSSSLRHDHSRPGVKGNNHEDWKEHQARNKTMRVWAHVVHRPISFSLVALANRLSNFRSLWLLHLGNGNKLQLLPKH